MSHDELENTISGSGPSEAQRCIRRALSFAPRIRRLYILGTKSILEF